MPDSRRQLLDLLARYVPVDDNDRAQAARVRAFVESTPACFDRSNAAGHVTGSAWLVDAKGKRALLTHHKKLNKWLQLGGHADGNADVLAVAMREAREESGLTGIEPVTADIFDLDVHWIPKLKNEPGHFHYDVRFALRASGSDVFAVSGESHGLAWIDVAAIAAVTSEESMLRMSRKWYFLSCPSN